jgi:hypothetical protein
MLRRVLGYVLWAPKYMSLGVEDWLLGMDLVSFAFTPSLICSIHA